MPSKETLSEQTTSDEMPTSGEEDYEAPSAAPPSNSVFDFLYQDVRRIGSFLAQFEEYGVRQSVKATEAVGQTQAVKGTASGTIGLPAVMGGSATIDTTTTDETKDLAEHTFDPLWANARRFLDYIESNINLKDDLWSANIGSFVRISGSISVVDLQYIQSVLRTPTLRRSFAEQHYRENNIKKGSAAAAELDRNVELVLSMPHGIQLTVYSNTDNSISAWSSISQESLTTNTADLILKHGTVLRGFWQVIGILDAVPDVPIPTDDNPTAKTADDYVQDMLPKELTKFAATLASATRELIGRPRHQFGITPILIFREV
ncbi:hypothetical protein [Methylorubrum extorquens]|uniref:DUF6414 family protein n=1 Tax=Methylorubrum extorquens TaxID=408 RepID=UPI002238B360|nr:hypothetical protein [Methylorubrum extorquens]UYW33622.1 hypothetical protein OKB92_05950 [Methylorubrum extorquens]